MLYALLSIALLLLVVCSIVGIAYCEGKKKYTFLFLGIFSWVSIFGLYHVCSIYGTSWYNQGFIVFETTTINNYDNSIIDPETKVSYKIDEIIDESNDSQKVKYKVIVKTEFAGEGLWSVKFWNDDRETVIVHIKSVNE